MRLDNFFLNIHKTLLLLLTHKSKTIRQTAVWQVCTYIWMPPISLIPPAPNKYFTLNKIDTFWLKTDRNEDI